MNCGSIVDLISRPICYFDTVPSVLDFDALPESGRLVNSHRIIPIDIEKKNVYVQSYLAKYDFFPELVMGSQS